MKVTTALGLAILSWSSVARVVPAAEAVVAPVGTQQGVPYVRIVAEPSGESHFEEGVLPFNFMKLPSGEVAGVHSEETSGRSNYMMFPPGVFEKFHPTPTSQLLVVIQGEVEVGTSDGQTRRFTPGMVVMMDDNIGKGHTTRTLGKVPHIALMMPKLAKKL